MSTRTNEKLWKSIVAKYKRGSKGGRSGQWSARKAQMAVQEYKRRGGKYHGKKSANNSLVIWTKADWQYIGKPGKSRYLPAQVRKRLTPAEKRRENRLKQNATKKGKQRASWSRSVARKFRKYGGRPKRTLPKRRRMKNGTLVFRGFPQFRPNLTPREIFKLGSFGGTYWRPIRSGVTKKNYQNKHKEFPASWWKGIPNNKLTSSVCCKELNKYKVNSGTSLLYWEKKKWIKPQDPYGWVQWYCRFYRGRRTADDARQIKRWLAFAGPSGRFRLRLINMIRRKRKKYNDLSVSPVIRQGLQHWAYQLTAADYHK